VELFAVDKRSAAARLNRGLSSAHDNLRLSFSMPSASAQALFKVAGGEVELSREAMPELRGVA